MLFLDKTISKNNHKGAKCLTKGEHFLKNPRKKINTKASLLGHTQNVQVIKKALMTCQNIEPHPTKKKKN